MSPPLFAPTSTLHIFRIAIYRTSPLTTPSPLCVSFLWILPSIWKSFGPTSSLGLGLSGCRSTGTRCDVSTYTKSVGSVLHVQLPFSAPNHRLILTFVAPRAIRTLRNSDVSSIPCRPSAHNIGFVKLSNRSWFLGIQVALKLVRNSLLILSERLRCSHQRAMDMKVLPGSGADVRAKDNKSQISLDVASACGIHEMTRYLTENMGVNDLGTHDRKPIEWLGRQRKP